MDNLDISSLEEDICNAKMLHNVLLNNLKYYEQQEGRFCELVYISELLEIQFKKICEIF